MPGDDLAHAGGNRAGFGKRVDLDQQGLDRAERAHSGRIAALDHAQNFFHRGRGYVQEASAFQRRFGHQPVVVQPGEQVRGDRPFLVGKLGPDLAHQMVGQSLGLGRLRQVVHLVDGLTAGRRGGKENDRFILGRVADRAGAGLVQRPVAGWAAFRLHDFEGRIRCERGVQPLVQLAPGELEQAHRLGEMGRRCLADPGLGALNNGHFDLPFGASRLKKAIKQPSRVEYRCMALIKQDAIFMPLAWELH